MNQGEPESLALKRMGHAAAIQALLSEAQAKLPLDVLANLRSRIARMVQETIQEGQERPSEELGYWWIHSGQHAPWAGLRMAMFGRAVNGPIWFSIIGESDSRRIGIRDWEAISAEEGWTKVERIPTPVLLEE